MGVAERILRQRAVLHTRRVQSRICDVVWGSGQPEHVAATNGGSTGMAPCLTAMQSAMSGVVYLRPGSRLGLTLVSA